MENTLENKAKFFAQYWGQKVLKGIPSDLPGIGYRRVMASNIDRGIMFSFLELKPLSQITDEDAIEVAKIWYNLNRNHTVNDGKDVARAVIDFSQSVTTISKTIKAIDYLRSKGYALPYMDISVEQQIEYGWVKLVCKHPRGKKDTLGLGYCKDCKNYY